MSDKEMFETLGKVVGLFLAGSLAMWSFWLLVKGILAVINLF